MEKFRMKKFGFQFEIYIGDDKSIRTKILEAPHDVTCKLIMGLSKCIEETFNKDYGVYLAMKRALGVYYGKIKEELNRQLKSFENEENDIQETLSYLMEKSKNEIKQLKTNKVNLEDLATLEKFNKIQDKSNEIEFIDELND
jgi:exonuclease VII large subunit